MSNEQNPAGGAATPAGSNQAAPGGSPPPPPGSGITTNIPSLEKYRIERAYRLGLIGFLTCIGLAAVLAVLTMIGLTQSEVVSDIVSPFLTLLGTLVGVFFGIQVGSSGKEELSQQAKDSNNQAVAFAAAADPKTLENAIQAYSVLSAKKKNQGNS
jgi:hypothetical protein